MPRLSSRLFGEVNLKEKIRDLVEGQSVPTSRAWYSGIVTDIDTIGVMHPLYSVRVMVDEGITPTTEIGDMEWFEPLMPLHVQRIPERFERVWVTFMNIANQRVGFWMSRMTEKNPGSQKVASVDGSSMQDQFTYGGIPFREGTPFYDALSKNSLMGDLVNRKTGLLPRPSKWLNVMPGDVVIQGGYNSAIRQTYDPWSGRSRVQIQAGFGSTDPASEVLDSWDNPYSPEANGGYHSSIHVLEKSPFDQLCLMPQSKGGFDVPFHETFNDFAAGAGTISPVSEGDMFGAPNADQKLEAAGALDSFISLTTYGHIRLINIDPASHVNGSNPICHVAMAEPLVPILNELISVVSSLANQFHNHEHLHPMGPTMMGPTSKTYVPLVPKAVEMKQRINGLAEASKLNEIASKHVAVN